MKLRGTVVRVKAWAAVDIDEHTILEEDQETLAVAMKRFTLRDWEGKALAFVPCTIVFSLPAKRKR